MIKFIIYFIVIITIGKNVEGVLGFLVVGVGSCIHLVDVSSATSQGGRSFAHWSTLGAWSVSGRRVGYISGWLVMCGVRPIVIVA